jgi:8-oxo-dGTP pyrophosphatase MutT (NUDIX family)
MIQSDYEVVDESGRPTGQMVSKHVAHTTKVLHRVAGMLLHDADGRYIIQYRQPIRGIRMYDASVGGHVDPGETPDHAALREAQEELGILPVLAELKLIGRNMLVEDIYPEVGVYARHLITGWHGQVPAGWQFVSNDEVPEIRYMTKQEIITEYYDHPNQWTKGLIVVIRAMGWL